MEKEFVINSIPFKEFKDRDEEKEYMKYMGYSLYCIDWGDYMKNNKYKYPTYADDEIKCNIPIKQVYRRIISEYTYNSSNTLNIKAKRIKKLKKSCTTLNVKVREWKEWDIECYLYEHPEVTKYCIFDDETYDFISFLKELINNTDNLINLIPSSLFSKIGREINTILSYKKMNKYSDEELKTIFNWLDIKYYDNINKLNNVYIENYLFNYYSDIHNKFIESIINWNLNKRP